MTPPDEVASDLSAFAGTWTLDPARTTIEFHTKAMWVLPVTGTAKALEGRGVVAPDGTVSGTLVIDAASIDTKNKKRDAHLRTDDFFAVDNHPTIVFTLGTGHLTGAGTLELVGDLTVHGRARPLTLTAGVTAEDRAATVTTEVEIDRSEFGLTWSKMGAGLHNRVVITAHFDRS
jgi:polyisoprenoid-binding protein YceI